MLNEYVKKIVGKEIDGCGDRELYAALLQMTNEMAAAKKKKYWKKETILYIGRVPDRKAFEQ